MKQKLVRQTVLQMIGAVMAQCMVLTYNPIAMAYFAALYITKTLRWLSFAVILISMSFLLPVTEVVKYGMIMLIIIVCVGLIEARRDTCGAYAVGAIAGLSTFLMELSETLLQPIDYRQIGINAFVGLLTFGLTVIFHTGIRAILDNKKGVLIKNEDMISLAIMIGAIVYFSKDFQILSFSFVDVMIYFSILFCGYKYGSGMGGIVGTSCGIVMSLTQGNIEILGVLCLLGILAGAFRELGRLGTMAGFLSGVFALGFLYAPFMIEDQQIRGVLSAVVLFVLLPRSIIYRYDRQDQGVDDRAGNTMPEYETQRLHTLARSFESLSKSFWDLPKKKTALSTVDMDHMFEAVSSRLCKNCEKCDYCWKKASYETYNETSYLFKMVENQGAICLDDVPTPFLGKCLNVEGFVSEVNHLFEQARLNLIWHNKLVESREAIAVQLQEMAGIIGDFSKQVYDIVDITGEVEETIKQKLRAKRIIVKKIVVLESKNKVREVVITAKAEWGKCVTTKEMANVIGEVLEKKLKVAMDSKSVLSGEFCTVNLIEDTNFLVKYGSAKKAKDKEDISGDNFAFLEMNSGQIIMSLSDGMGSGAGAYRESETVIELLEQLLESGFSEEVAIKLINSVMVLNSDAECTTTVDMGIMDLYSGVCDFVKLGAASTFIKRGNWVEIIKSTTLPMGVFQQIDYESTSKKLYHGDFVIMVSDGMIDGLDCDNKEYEMINIIMDVTSKNPKEMASQIMDKVLERSSGNSADDMTVLVSGIWEKG